MVAMGTSVLDLYLRLVSTITLIFYYASLDSFRKERLVQHMPYIYQCYKQCHVDYRMYYDHPLMFSRSGGNSFIRYAA